MRGRSGPPEQAPAEVRIDRWLWAVRAFKTRSSAAAACRSGHVKSNGRTAKPSTKVACGDRIVVRRGERTLDLEVVSPIDRRVGAALAEDCFVDHSPPVPERRAAEHQGSRDRGTGRPTKKERRELDRLRGRRR